MSPKDERWYITEVEDEGLVISDTEGLPIGHLDLHDTLNQQYHMRLIESAPQMLALLNIVTTKHVTAEEYMEFSRLKKYIEGE